MSESPRLVDVISPCRTCSGTGERPGYETERLAFPEPCRNCSGAGHILTGRAVDIRRLLNDALNVRQSSR